MKYSRIFIALPSAQGEFVMEPNVVCLRFYGPFNIYGHTEPLKEVDGYRRIRAFTSLLLQNIKDLLVH